MIGIYMLNPNEEFKLPKIEEKVLEFWKKNNVFQKSLALRRASLGKARDRQGKDKTKKTFVFYEGPPYANGRPGIHHVLARAFKDIILRYKTMRGFYVPRRAGWDTHGLPTEIEVEKKLGIKNKKEIEKFGIDLFNQKARESVWGYKEEWERLTERIGYWLDMKNAYVTYENNYVESLWWIFKAVSDRGFLKESRKIVPYCPRCETPLASHELAMPGVYRKVPDPSVYVKFRVLGQKNSKVKSNTYFLVWTTTPWTLPSNMFIAADPELVYTKYKVGKEFLWSYNPPPAPRAENGKQIEVEAVEKISGNKLVGLSYEPVFVVPHSEKEKLYKILPADFILTEEGTGFVHIAPAFGEEDFKLVSKIYPDLEIFAGIDNRGRLTGQLPGAGKFIKEADADLAKDLLARGLMYLWTKIEHEYPFCWRCGAPLIYFARRAWFFEVSRLRKELLARNAKINWTPAHLKDGRFGEWLKDAKDWAISRERYWGAPLPIWRCKDCGEIKVAGSLAELEENDYFKNQFYLVRHTEGTHIVSGLVASGPEKGAHVAHLTKKGIGEAEKLAQTLKKEKIDIIYSSPYARCKELAKIIGKASGAKVIYDERLAEINTGIFNWQKVSDYRKFFKNPAERYIKVPPGGENLTDVLRRVFAFAKEVNQKYRGKKILVASHGDSLWMLESALTQKTKEEAMKLKEFGLGETRKFKFPNLPSNDLGEVDLHRPYADQVYLACGKCGGKAARVKEVADVWFDSGAMPFASTHFPFVDAQANASRLTPQISKIPYPADYICEAVDQTRGWFYTMLAVATLLGYEAPYKNVISLGLIHDKNGLKMSKSKGNAVDPWEIIEKYGVDAVRWYFYTVNPAGEPKNFDEAEILKSYRKFHLLAYNSFVFFRTYGKKPSAKPAVSKNIMDRWILSRLSEVSASAMANLDNYEIREAALCLEGFVDDLSRWYIRRSRRRLQKPEKAKDFQAVSDTLYGCLLAFSKLVAPFMPFMSEALYLDLTFFAGKKEGSVHLADWPEMKAKPDKKLLEQMKEVRR
ncbi:MAG: class I tRNA ligase family protein, partial [Candidatus Liptonbacteria bacterium]|nr:class I tRNA ligase family protein [Candidatus Liptonbacteria bacterium]